MGIFLITPLGQNIDRVSAAVQEKIPESDRHKLQNNAGWLVSYNGTTVELSNHLGVTGQPQGETSPVGSALVTPLSSYYGRGPSDMWEWLKTRFESQ